MTPQFLGDSRWPEQHCPPRGSGFPLLYLSSRRSCQLALRSRFIFETPLNGSQTMAAVDLGRRVRAYGSSSTKAQRREPALLCAEAPVEGPLGKSSIVEDLCYKPCRHAAR
jgi:hypothetical protein